MSLSHAPLAYLIGQDHCADILALMTPAQLLIAFLRASGYTDAAIGRALDLPPTTVTRAMDALARAIAHHIPELRPILAGRARCPGLALDIHPGPVGDPPPPPLSVSQAAERLGRVPATIRLWCRQGRFPHAFKSGRHWRIPPSDLDQPLTPRRDGDLTAAQVARRLHLNLGTVNVWCAEGRLPGAYKDGPSRRAPWRIPPSALDQPAQPPSGDTLSTTQVAQRLNLSPRSVRTWCQQGRFPGAYRDQTRIQSPWRIPITALAP